MYIKYSIYILCVTITYGYTQNIVPNPSFEDTLHCPTTMSSISDSPPWFSANNIPAKYFNNCNQGDWGVPNNIEGHQLSHTGNAYAGIATYGAGGEFREYLQVKLISSLIGGNNYCVEVFVSLADSQTVAANNIGVYFSVIPINENTNGFINVIPQIQNDIVNNPLTNKTIWTKISGKFSAGGGENYIVIGNFLSDINTDTVHYSGVLPGSYYYIDDVSVICCDCNTDSSSLFIPNTFTPNNDGINEEFKVQAQNIKEFKGMIYNRWGQLLHQWEDVSKGWDGKYKGNNVPEGIYIYAIKATGSDGVEYNKRGTLLVIR